MLYARKEEELPKLGGDLITAKEAIVSCHHFHHQHLYIPNMTKIHQKKAFLGPSLFSLLTLLITEAERAVLGFSKQHPKVELAEDWDRLQRTRRCQNQNHPTNCALDLRKIINKEKSNTENKREFILDGDQVNMVQQLRKENGKRLLTLLLCICPGKIDFVRSLCVWAQSGEGRHKGISVGHSGIAFLRCSFLE